MKGPSELYLDLLKKSLLNLVHSDPEELVTTTSGQELSRADARRTGLDWPRSAYTMIGWERLDSLQNCIEQILDESTPGDLIETGVWRGGASILMRAVLRAHGNDSRVVWVADSFQGVPPPNPEHYPQDKDLSLHLADELAVSQDEVEENFRRYDLLDNQVRFLPGWFKDTLPSAPIENLALIRLDGDLYESTLDALSALYPKLSVGGFVVIDDYGAIPACKQAVIDYRSAHGIMDPVQLIDWTGAYWKRT